MIKLIKNSEYIKSIWKNGLGSTLEIAIDPPGALVAENNFDWRLSSASITKASPFSSFAGLERWLIVWQGSGLILNQKKLSPYTPFQFSGETAMDCQLLDEQTVIDLGLIYNSEKFSARLVVESFLESSEIEISSGLHFFFLAKGKDCQLDQSSLQEGDTLRVENEKRLRLQCRSEVIFFHFYLIALD